MFRLNAKLQKSKQKLMENTDFFVISPRKSLVFCSIYPFLPYFRVRQTKVLTWGKRTKGIKIGQKRGCKNKKYIFKNVLAYFRLR